MYPFPAAAVGRPDTSYLGYRDTPHAFLNFPGALSAAWRAMQDIADDLTTSLSLSRQDLS